MELEAFTEPAYRLESPNAESSVMRNCHLEMIEHGSRKGKLRIRGIPGMPTFTTLPDSPLRALLEIDGGNRLFAVAGATVFEIFPDGTFLAATGAVNLNSHPAIMVSNGFQLAIASGQALYIVSGVDENTPALVTPVNFLDPTTDAPGADPVQAQTLDFLDNYLIANVLPKKNLDGSVVSGMAVFISNLAPDGGRWDPGDVKIKEGYPDNVSRVFSDNEQLWVFGFDTTEVWMNTGALFPFERIQGAVLKIGCSAPYSVAAARGFRFWLWQGAVYSAYGFDPQRVSDCGVEEAIKTYGNTDDAEGWCQISGPHIFYFLNFPSARRTWTYDKSLGAWHERGLFERGQYGIYRGRVYAKAFGKDLVGDPQNGNIYWLDPHTYTDAGGLPLRWQRTAPYITENLANVRFNQLKIDADTGVGLGVASDQPGYDPQMILRYSDDRGKTFGNERSASMGKIGETKVRIIYNQLGSSRIGKTFELSGSDPVPISINTAFLDLGQPEKGRE